MGRSYLIYGETMISVKGSPTNETIKEETELGLATGAVTITPKFYHKDINVDDFGPSVPVEVQCMLADVHITFNLIHFDDDVLTACLEQSLAGASDGTMPGAGSLLGNGLASGGENKVLGLVNNYITLIVESLDENGATWTFPSTYMPDNPAVYPLGVERSLVQCTFRAIPYIPLPNDGTELISKGAVLWTIS